MQDGYGVSINLSMCMHSLFMSPIVRSLSTENMISDILISSPDTILSWQNSSLVNKVKFLELEHGSCDSVT